MVAQAACGRGLDALLGERVEHLGVGGRHLGVPSICQGVVAAQGSDVAPWRARGLGLELRRRSLVETLEHQKIEDACASLHVIVRLELNVRDLDGLDLLAWMQCRFGRLDARFFMSEIRGLLVDAMRVVPLTDALALQCLESEVVEALALLLEGYSVDHLLPHVGERSPLVFATVLRVSSHLHAPQTLLQFGSVHRLVVDNLLPRGWRALLLLW